MTSHMSSIKHWQTLTKSRYSEQLYSSKMSTHKINQQLTVMFVWVTSFSVTACFSVRALWSMYTFAIKKYSGLFIVRFCRLPCKSLEIDNIFMQCIFPVNSTKVVQLNLHPVSILNCIMGSSSYLHSKNEHFFIQSKCLILRNVTELKYYQNP